jgi:hypothetical protein
MGQIKKIIVISFLSNIFSISAIFGQKIDFNIQTDSTKVGNSYEYSVTISIVSGIEPFQIQLFEGAPEKGGNEIRNIKAITSKKYTIDKLKKVNNYYVFVISQSNKSGRGKKVEFTNKLHQ